MSGLFGTLNIGRSGLFANQRAIDVTSHNIANANTEGYSRQRAEMYTSRPFCTPSMNNAAEPGQLGTGVTISQISRIRDSFLDYQVRVENGVQGWYEGRNDFLSEIENMLSEPSDTGLSSLIGKFFDSWHELSKKPAPSNARTLAMQQSVALTDELNHTYTQLEKLKDNARDVIKQTVFDVNGIVSQIDKINEEIIQISVAGNNPNDLMDRRDLLLDELSSKFGITIDKKNFNAIELSTRDDKEANTPTSGAKNLVNLINPDNVARFAYINKIEETTQAGATDKKEYKLVYYKDGDMTSEENRREINISVKLRGTTKEEKSKEIENIENMINKIDESRVLWTNKNGEVIGKDGNTLSELDLRDIDFTDYEGNIENQLSGRIPTFTPSTGELKGYMSVQEDIDGYIDQMNKLAKSIAFSANAIFSQSASYTADDVSNGIINNFFVNKDPGSLTGEDAENAITAGNILVNKEIIDDVKKIRTSLDNSGEGDGKLALAMTGLRDTIMMIQNISSISSRESLLKSEDGLTSADLFIENEYGVKVIKSNNKGIKIDDYFKDVVNKLGVQTQEAKRMVKNQYTLLASFQQSRDSVSGVSIDEEVTNMIQYQHAYQSNAKVIATVDELLDVIINGLKR